MQFRIQADRAALRLTCDLHAATRAILRSSSNSLDAADRVESEGLAEALRATGDHALRADEALRLTTLVRDALDMTSPQPSPTMYTPIGTGGG